MPSDWIHSGITVTPRPLTIRPRPASCPPSSASSDGLRRAPRSWPSRTEGVCWRGVVSEPARSPPGPSLPARARPKRPGRRRVFPTGPDPRSRRDRPRDRKAAAAARDSRRACSVLPLTMRCCTTAPVQRAMPSVQYSAKVRSLQGVVPSLATSRKLRPCPSGSAGASAAATMLAARSSRLTTWARL